MSELLANTLPVVALKEGLDWEEDCYEQGELCPSEEEKAKRGSQFDKELGFKEYGDLAHGLKKITYSCINHNDAVYTYEKKGDIILERLVEFYRDNTLFLPPEYRVENFIHEINEDKKMLQERLICDYISGMMDSYAISQYEKITGEQFSKIVL